MELRSRRTTLCRLDVPLNKAQGSAAPPRLFAVVLASREQWRQPGPCSRAAAGAAWESTLEAICSPTLSTVRRLI